MPETTIHNRSDSLPNSDIGLDALNVRGGAYRAMWPLGLLIVGELYAAIVLAPNTGINSVVLFGMAIAMLLVGIVPALLRPSGATHLLGCHTVVLASIFWHVSSILSILSAPTLRDFALALTTPEHYLALINIALLAPLTLHLAACVPQRGILSTRILIGYDLLIAGIVLALFVLPSPANWAVSSILLLTIDAGFVLAGYHCVRTIQTAPALLPHSPRIAQQARLVLLSIITAETPLLLLPISELLNLDIPIAFVLIAQMMLPLGIACAILRRNLLGVDAGLRRTLDFTTVSFGLLVMYAALNTLLTQIVGGMGLTWGIAMTMLSVIPVAAAFPPLQRATQRLTDRIFYPERIAFGQAISAARTTLSLAVQREAVIALLEHNIPQQLGAPWATLVLRPSFDQPAATAQLGVWSMLLTVGGQPLGCYWLGPRYSGMVYATDEQEQLRGLVQQAALALAYAETFDSLVRLNHDLEERVAIRTEHVLAQQLELATFEERQRLARDLHDSVKQTLFSLGLGLRSVRNQVRTDPDAAVALLQQQEQAALLAQTEMGDLLAQLRTPNGRGEAQQG